MAGIGWLGWRFVDQDRALEGQRVEEELENAANLLVRELEQSLTAWQEMASAAANDNVEPLSLHPDTVFLAFDQGRIVARQGIPLPWVPVVPSRAEAPTDVFRDAESLEFRERDFAGAAAVYQALAETPDPLVRAGALVRLARSFRQQGQLAEALVAYDELSTMSGTPVEGTPAELIARRERIGLLETTGQTEASSREAASLARILSEGRYLIDRPTFDFYAASVPEYLPVEGQGAPLAAVVDSLWLQWQVEASGHAARAARGESFVAIWEQVAGKGAAIIGPVDALTGSVGPMLEDLSVRLALEDPQGHTAWGSLTDSDAQVVRARQETGLPWTVRVEAADIEAALQSATERRSLMAAGFLLMVLVMGTAGYVAFRAVKREQNVARLQSDFVAAVSHEFRTPLTAMRHLTDMLEEGRAGEARMPRYFRALGSETRRLQAMVENLLDFARMEAGQRTYKLEAIDATGFAKGIVEEFHEHASARDQAVEFETLPVSDGKSGIGTPIHADRDALALALSNLIENGLKYSPASTRVSVSVESREGFAGIAVRDEGPGIPKSEQETIFGKFVRGGGRGAHEVKGTGIGLTIAQQIVEAHGGRLELESEPGHGSCFTMWLPLEGDAR